MERGEGGGGVAGGREAAEASCRASQVAPCSTALADSPPPPLIFSDESQKLSCLSADVAAGRARKKKKSSLRFFCFWEIHPILPTNEMRVGGRPFDMKSVWGAARKMRPFLPQVFSTGHLQCHVNA